MSKIDEIDFGSTNDELETINNEEDEDVLKVVYAVNVGIDLEGKNIYQFMFSSNSDETYGDDWGETPAANIPNDRLMIDESMYDYIKEVRTELKLDLAQDNCCFSMQDCRDRIVPLAFENISNYEEYPEPYRIVIHFGDTIDEVEQIFSDRDLKMKFV